jgi:CIC family chloride channel protein
VQVRSQRALLLAALTGGLTGLAVAAFDWVVNQQLVQRMLDAPLAVQAVVPVLGLAVAAVALRTIGHGASPSTSDEYIRNFHDVRHRLDLRPVWGRIVAGAATLGAGGAMGFEGPSLYLGASIGTALQRRWSKVFSRDETKLLMVAGAAAGVAAIFKAPATGAIFALEVPYKDDNARRMLLPALLAAAVGYLVFVALLGTRPLFEVAGTPPFDLRELGGAVALGLTCGLGARLFARVITAAKRVATRGRTPWRVAGAGFALAALAVGSALVFGQDLALGPGYRTLVYVTAPDHALLLLVALFVFRLAATSVTVAGGGVGGLFIPLVIAGAITGQAAATVLHDPSTLFPLIGVAAFLGAGYRTPLAGVVFVAETTGRPGFVVPGLIASVASQLVMGDVSVSPYQAAARTGHLERRLRLPVASAVDTEVPTVAPDTTLRELAEQTRSSERQTEIAVVDDGRYVGMASLDAASWSDDDRWSTRPVGEIVDADWPSAELSSNLEQAIRVMEDADVDTVPVLDGEHFVGVVTTSDILRLDLILGPSDDDP